MKHLDYFNAQAAREPAPQATASGGGVLEALGAVFEFVCGTLRILIEIAQLFV